MRRDRKAKAPGSNLRQAHGSGEAASGVLRAEMPWRRADGRRASVLAGILLTCLLLLLVCALTRSGSSAVAADSCPNEAIRAQQGSTFLSQCRAYEMVTPNDLNGRPLAGTGFATTGGKFEIPAVTSKPDTYFWSTLYAGLPGTESNGWSNLYEANRTQHGWVSSRRSPKATQAEKPELLNYSADGEYSQYVVPGYAGGELAPCSDCFLTWVRHPDGSFHFLGEGTVATDSDTDGYANGLIDATGRFGGSVRPKWMSSDGQHQIFETEARLLPTAPPTLPNGSGWGQLYDRTPEGLRMISLLPGDAPPPEAVAQFLGASADGRVVLFTMTTGVGSLYGSLYARLDNQETVQLASGAFNTFEDDLAAGVADDGSRAFFVKAGDIYRYDFATEQAAPVATPGDAVVVRVSPDGSHVYFTTETELVPGKGTLNEPNLYVWDGTDFDFIATVTQEDMGEGTEYQFGWGLGRWARPTGGAGGPAAHQVVAVSTARTTPDGRFLVFESRAQLTTYPNEGHREIYRYDTVSKELTCVSCSAAQSAATADSILRPDSNTGDGAGNLNVYVHVQNVSDDGNTVAFESLASLLPEDVNVSRDVYVWHNGELALVSSGHSAQGSALWGMTPNGSDVFFTSADNLVPQQGFAFAIYDARINGGFADDEEAVFCQGEACLGSPSEPPALATPASATLVGNGNVKAFCRKHKRRHHHARKHRRAKHRKAGHASSASRKAPCKPARTRTGR